MHRAKIPQLLLVAAALLASGGAQAQAVNLIHHGNVYDGHEGPLKAPEGVACTDQALVVGDTGNKRLVLYTLKDGVATPTLDVKLPQLTAPTRVQIDSKGNVLVLDGKTRKVVKIAPNGGFGGTLEVPARGKDPLVVGSFKLDARDSAYLLDVAGKRVLVLDSTGSLAGQVAFPKDAATVTDLAVDTAGTVYLVDAVGSAIWAAEKGASAFRALATNLSGRMNFATAITTSRGRLYLVDRHGNGVVAFGIDGSYLGRQLAIGSVSGLVNYPGDLCLSPNGHAFIADTLNNRVQVFTVGSK